MTIATINRAIAQEIQEKVGTNVNLCYHCKKCTSGCPFVQEMDLVPNQVMRALQFGQTEKVLSSKTIWMCASCKTCTTRCPNDIDITGVMDYLKSKALESGVTPKVPEIATFIKVATRNVQMFGRMYELAVAGELNLRAGQPFRDISIANRLIKSGRLNLLPPQFGFHSAKPESKSGGDTIAYYPGCSAHGTAKDYDMSMRVVAGKLGLALEEPKGWTCCGTTAAEWRSPSLGHNMSKKNLELVEKMGQSAVSTPCPACYFHLRHAATVEQEGHESSTHEPTGIDVQHVVDTMLQRVGLDKIKASATKSLKGLKAVCYYGCLMTRPPRLTGAKNAEYPMSVDNVVRALGAQTLDWNYKTECCGASHVLSKTDVALPAIQRILQDAKDVGAEMVVVACPMCQSNLDTRQEAILDRDGKAFDIPIVYFTQLMGVAMGAGEKELGLDKNLIDPRPLLKAKGFLA